MPNHRHNWALLDGGFADKYYMGRKSNALMPTKTVGALCLECHHRGRIPFERAGLLPVASGVLESSAGLYVQVVNIGDGSPHLVQVWRDYRDALLRDSMPNR